MVYGKKKNQRRTLLLLMPILLLVAFLSVLTVSRSQSCLYHERIEFKYDDTTFHANLYHPTNKIDFQDKHPLVIFIHGFFGQKDMDSRAPLELAKRGFYVACVDIPGHGESVNSGLLDTDEDGEFVATQICSKLLDKIENLRVYSQIDEDQIGLLGFSYGGYVALMNGLYDDRFKVTVTWSGVADIMRVSKTFKNVGYEIDKDKKDLLHENNPVEVMNNGSKQPDNLFLIVHKDDTWYKYNKRLQDLTDCKWEVFKYEVRHEQEAHFLLHKNVVIKTINWFENKFFDSTSKNGPIQLSYQYDFLLVFLTMLAMIFTTFSLMIYVSKHILKKGGSSYSRTPPKKTGLPKAKTPESSVDSARKKRILIFTLSIFIFVGIWIFCYLVIGFWAYIFASGLNILVYLVFIRKILPKKEPELEKKLSFKNRISLYFKSESTKRSLGYAAICAGIVLGLYFSFALYYPFYLLYPHTFFAFALAIIYFPLYLSTEIFYRKTLYPSLEFIKSKKKRTIVITIITVFLQMFLMLLMVTLFVLNWPLLMATQIAFMVSSLMNGIIYHKTENFGAVLLNSFIILGIFYGAYWSFILNLMMIIN